MGAIITIFAVVITEITACLGSLIFRRTTKEDESYNSEWFGRGVDQKDNASKEDTAIRPFRIEVPDQTLSDLKLRLENTRFEESIPDTKFLDGFNSKYLQEVVEYWKTQYDWKKAEEYLNTFEHFKTRIEGLDVHFLHAKPNLPENKQVKVIPLLMIHGWPGSFFEFYKILPKLINTRQDHGFVFEVICPSIPGYTFSEPPHHKGFNSRVAARIFVTLMERLGHVKFYAQGGDWGSHIAMMMARYYPTRVVGLHLNMVTGLHFKLWTVIRLCVISVFPFLISADERKLILPLKKKLQWILKETGYYHIQATKPNTFSSAMCDSPAGMAAYILEKISVGTNPEYVNLPDGGLTKKFSLDELLTNVMLYWVNNCFASAVRFYRENTSTGKYEKSPITVPSGVAVFPHEVLTMPKMFLSAKFKKLVSYNMMPRGGHFAAMEEPELLADDVWKFVGKVEKQ